MSNLMTCNRAECQKHLNREFEGGLLFEDQCSRHPFLIDFKVSTCHVFVLLVHALAGVYAGADPSPLEPAASYSATHTPALVARHARSRPYKPPPTTTMDFLIRPAGNSEARFVGHRPSTELRWQVDRHLWFQADYGIFYAGKFLKETQPGRNLNYWALWAGYKF
jgi:hypothetical protein